MAFWWSSKEVTDEGAVTKGTENNGHNNAQTEDTKHEMNAEHDKHEVKDDSENEDDDGEDDDEDDDDPDEWDQRIMDTGCAKESEALQLCHYDKKDWRLCMDEMIAFKKCWTAHNNNERTHAKDNDMSKW